MYVKVSGQYDGQRLDNFLIRILKNVPKSRIYNLIRKGEIRINKGRCKADSRLTMDDIIRIPPIRSIRNNENPVVSNSLKKYISENILFEDKDLLVFNKPSGLAVHGGSGISMGVIEAFRSLRKSDEYLELAHRIDKDTSGLVVVAKNNKTHEKLSSQFNDHTIKRVYQALVWGKLRPQTGRIETLITRSSKNRQLMEVGLTKGKNAITNYKTLEIFENDKIPTFSLIECRLETGRTHQIRVHMSYKGNNILGDKKYKKKFKKFRNINDDLKNLILKLDRQFLHAKTLGFTHPSKNKEVEFTSKLPQDLNTLLKKLRNSK